MDRMLAVRVVALYAPAMLAAIPWAVQPPPRARIVGALLACAWNLPALLLVNVMAVRMGWWGFAPTDASLAGIPVDLLLGWIVLWGAVPALLLPRAHVVVVVAALLLLDLALMPLAHPVVSLGGDWLLGEAFGLVVALVPSQLLARWTVTDRKVELRGAMQAITLTTILLWVLPQLVFERASGDWTTLLENWRASGGLHLQVAAVPALMGIAAVREFAQRGRGTPIPFDPPRRLVTSGPYAFVANPMQLSIALMLIAWGIVLQSWWLTLAGPMAVAYGLGLAAGDERSDLHARFGEPWRMYRRRVREWIPRWRPFHASVDTDAGAGKARLYVAEGCGQCSQVARWFMARAPRGLEVVPAEQHPDRDLTRVTYDPRDGGGDETGVAAIARALEHIHFGWALLAWVVRLPGVSFVLQLVADASGAEARLVRRTSAGSPECRI